MDDYEVRIDDKFLKGDHKDGEVLTSSDLNELENVVKTAINANYEDIQKLGNGEIPVGDADTLTGASLSKYNDEALQNSDTKIPSSMQVKQYVDGAISNIDLEGYYTKREVDDIVATYDSDGNGIVDNAEKVNNHTVNKDVPADAKFTDTIVTKTSELTNDSGFLTSETDPVFNASPAKTITNTNISNWNSKQAALVSGSNIKTINGSSILGSGNLTVQTNLTAGDNISINNNVISATDTKYTGGTNVTIDSNNAINVDLSSKQDTLTAGTGIDITNNVISASGGEVDTEVYTLTTDFNNLFADVSLNSHDINILNKAIDSLRAGNNVVILAKQIIFYTYTNGGSYSYNVLGKISEIGTNINIDFYRNYANNYNTQPINFHASGLIRRIQLSNVGTPANITSAVLQRASTPNANANIISVANEYQYTVSGNYNPAHKLYVDTEVAKKQDIIQYSTMPTASSNNEGKIVQFVGTTTNDYTNGYFYKCVSDEEETPTYTWENVEVQASSGDIPIYVWNGNGWDPSSPNTNTDVKQLFESVYYRLKNKLPFILYLDKPDEIYTHRLYHTYIDLQSTIDSINILIIYRKGINTIYYNTWNSGANSFDSNGNLTKQIYSVSNPTQISNLQPYKSGFSPISMALTTTNTTAYTPISDYNPATKKYVDDSISSVVGSINTILATLTTPSNGGGN